MNRKWKSPTTDGKGKNNKIYLLWKSIKHRCCNKKDKSYKNYGGRGITICEDWLNFDNFYNWLISSNYKEGLQIDRINNDKGYSPENCHFVTCSENQRNKRPVGKIPVKGVHKHRKLNKYIACKRINGKTKYIGTFDTIEEASKAFQNYQIPV